MAKPTKRFDIDIYQVFILYRTLKQFSELIKDNF